MLLPVASLSPLDSLGNISKICMSYFNYFSDN